ncbi:hypothetical protein T440DRAFT_507266 [Plenodomus tracheiphilus IPT5]|uniref:Calcineurin-like phosphoesterase domain-containing protein n=1 Tax=Plenodomus tracheiphilus IPT5 TaxID=1408161 RepID=A0A6A7B7E7_9PLEO|nr:hypothetical protein T440DRAFT_507266 [Plenodomus tracheiphilus IPT5]
MSLLSPQFQIISDLHLETPISNPQYETYVPNIMANNVLLLGDIGLVKDAGLFTWLRRFLERNRSTRIFYILGNHEPYQLTLAATIQELRDFEVEANSEYGGRFKFLHRDRYDIDQYITILGCTLWTSVQSNQSAEVCQRLTDFNSARGIQHWSLENALEEHQKDLGWLNDQVLKIQSSEPNRQILVATHHCPTTDPRATNPAHSGSTVSSAFVSDLSGQPCWTSTAVKMWAFGHTHYDCMFYDGETGKLVIANQKDYNKKGLSTKTVEIRNDISSASFIMTGKDFRKCGSS